MKIVWQAIGGRTARCRSTQCWRGDCVFWLRGLVLFLCAVWLCPAGEHRLLICGAASKGYVVGMKLPPSGLFALGTDGAWEQRGYNHPYITAMDYDRRHPEVIYLAA